MKQKNVPTILSWLEKWEISERSILALAYKRFCEKEAPAKTFSRVLKDIADKGGVEYPSFVGDYLEEFILPKVVVINPKPPLRNRDDVRQCEEYIQQLRARVF